MNNITADMCSFKRNAGRYLLIMNPGSRSGKSRKSFDRILEELDAENIDYDFRITSSLDDAFRFSREGNIAGYDVIIAVGGDGTINKVLNGFFDNRGKRLSGARMGVIYTGTSPDFCKSYGIPVDIAAAVKVILENKVSSIQIGKITLARTLHDRYDGRTVDDGDEFAVRYFACCANIGLGAELAERANSGIRKILGDHMGTFAALVRTLASYRPGGFQVCKDGSSEMVKNVHSISVGRTFYIASGIKVRNKLQRDDGHFYCMTVKNMRKLDWPRVLKTIYSGKEITNDDIVSIEYLRNIDIYGNSRCPSVEFDGDPAGFLPCRICMAEDRLDLICGDIDINPGHELMKMERSG